MERDPKYPVRTTVRSFEIIEFLKENHGAGVTETAKALDMSKGVVHNHLNTLEAIEFVVKEDEEYRLSLRFLELGEYQRNQMRLYRIGREQVKELASETGELVNLATEEHGRCVYLSLSRGEKAVEADTYAGHRPYLHNTALGKAILAHLPDTRITEILDHRGLPQSTEHTITDRDVLFEELEAIRDRGVAFDRQERLSGLRCVAAPIKKNDGVVAGAISVSGPMTRMQGELFEETLPNAVRSTANVIELNLEYSN
ncbi:MULTISPECIES: IclR family transcriptional regulator [Natrialbaceae]|uniref:IclR family transcriptional regulator n=1 Tax=Natrialbaceae TaxID=1644061 RepID=UPI00207CF7BD|nr:IclR family transcriptional regulator [Natronococcus sp. CG52]